MKVISGTSSKQLAGRICEKLGCERAEVIIDRFPDDECYVRVLDDLNGEEVILVSNSYPDRNIVELFLLQDAIQLFKINGLTTVIPYFGYSRQDKLFKSGEAISAHSMARRIGLSTDSVILVDIHEPKIADWFGCEAISVSAMDEIGRFLADKGVDLIISPDEGAKDMARRAAEAAKVDHDHIVKHRIDASTVRMELKTLDVEGKTIGIVDDMISTGGTIMEAAKNIYAQGGKTIFAACTHGLFSGDALQRLKNSVDDVFSTDTIETASSIISIADTIRKALR